MPQFVVIAYDGTDPDALARRMAVRPAHLENVKPMVAAGQIIAGGALLDDAGGMIGSVSIVDFPDRAGLDHWLATDPYVTGKVWQKIEVKPFRLAVAAKG
ncbi:YciI family protein [Limobrevibacterium gyesilva]|uniref:YciI family protein n=1 Tax=Limobrevibacterium gyesilva TaxID=2991712 RepID=A0AA41YIE7_9PROT|nr:YciI family protein [Limobrevibacterium gyesilva]MCW3474149.1 YciI family protein [Limobrevibacterium gyesilva]